MTAVILAGGRSLRFGENKLLLPWGRRTFLTHAIALLSPLFEDVVIVVSRENGSAFRRLFPSVPRIVHDLVADAGPLGGIHAGLLSCRSFSAFVVGGDMPLLNPGLISFLTGLGQGYDAVVPRTTRGLEPLHSIYTYNCLPAIERRLQGSERRPSAIFPDLHVRIVEPEEMIPFDPELSSFTNINTKNDYRRLSDHIALEEGLPLRDRAEFELEVDFNRIKTPCHLQGEGR